MRKNKIIPEVFLLRSIACLSIVLLHSLNRIYDQTGTIPELITLMLTFGTPAFVFISELVISHSYPAQTPRKFWNTRISYILMPYIFFGIFYAFSKAINSWLFEGASFLPTFGTLTWRHLLIGDFQGYFIIIIFQFYLLHMVYQKYFMRFSAKWVLAGSLFVNLVYLGFFNFISSPQGPVLAYIWQQGYWLPFLGWLFYFSVAYYCGRYYQQFLDMLVKRQLWIYLLTGISAILLFILMDQKVLTVHSSKRVDMLFFTVGMIFVLYLIAHKLKTIPNSLIRVSQYSFGIYLLHPFYMGIMIILVNQVSWLQHSLWGVLFLFFGSIGLSIITTHVLNKTLWGSYVIGKIGIGNKGKTPASISTPNIQTRRI